MSGAILAGGLLPSKSIAGPPNPAADVKVAFVQTSVGHGSTSTCNCVLVSTKLSPAERAKVTSLLQQSGLPDAAPAINKSLPMSPHPTFYTITVARGNLTRKVECDNIHTSPKLQPLVDFLTEYCSKHGRSEDTPWAKPSSEK